VYVAYNVRTYVRHACNLPAGESVRVVCRTTNRRRHPLDGARIMQEKKTYTRIEKLKRFTVVHDITHWCRFHGEINIFNDRTGGFFVIFNYSQAVIFNPTKIHTRTRTIARFLYNNNNNYNNNRNTFTTTGKRSSSPITIRFRVNFQKNR